MKRIIILITIITSLLLITGCNQNQNATHLDIDKVSQSFDEKYKNMAVIDENQLQVIYGLDTSLMKKYIIKSSTLADGNFYALIHVDDKNKKQVQEQMDKMLKTMEEQSNLYSKEAVNLIKNRLETSIGDYLIYIISEDNNSMYEILKGYVD